MSESLMLPNTWTQDAVNGGCEGEGAQRIQSNNYAHATLHMG